jgi:hypothetical protein
MTMHHLHKFLSSPWDVSRERHLALALQIFSQINIKKEEKNMAWIRKQFDRYILSYDTERENANVVASITCYTSLPWKSVGQILFYLEEIPPNETAGNDFLKLHFSASRFNDIINILRYEKPLSLIMNTDTLYGALQTSSEETGEQEP